MDVGGAAVLAIVVGGLAVTTRAQIRPLRRHRALLDTLAIVPEWRFYAQASIGDAADYARDVHLVVRDRDKAGRIGGWSPILWHDERRLRHAIWSPRKRSDEQLLSIAEDLARSCRKGADEHVQQSIRYLILLRHCLDAPIGPDIEARQFAVVHSVGRGERALSIGFLSGWHRP